jgi:hypothetical protein
VTELALEIRRSSFELGDASIDFYVNCRERCTLCDAVTTWPG